MIKGFYGINIAVKDLDAAAKKYSAVLGVEPEFIGEKAFAFPGLRGATLKLGSVRINLIESLKPDTSIARFIETKGEGVFLVSLEVTDLAKDTKEAIAKGVQFVSDKPFTSLAGVVNFGHPKSMNGVQWEFLQPKGDWK